MCDADADVGASDNGGLRVSWEGAVRRPRALLNARVIVSPASLSHNHPQRVRTIVPLTIYHHLDVPDRLHAVPLHLKTPNMVRMLLG